MSSEVNNESYLYWTVDLTVENPKIEYVTTDDIKLMGKNFSISTIADPVLSLVGITIPNKLNVSEIFSIN